jgi:hypothetical protein
MMQGQISVSAFLAMLFLLAACGSPVVEPQVETEVELEPTAFPSMTNEPTSPPTAKVATQTQATVADSTETTITETATQTPVATAVPTGTPTHTPAPIDNLVVVFTRDNNAWLWTEDGGERQLTKDGGVDQVLLSDDKRVIAFRRGNGIWAINADGNDERQLVKESDLPIPQEGELADYITGMTIDQLVWIPGSHQLLFNTRLISDGPGLLLSDDLWRVDADRLSLENLFASGEGGNFAIAPDGKRVALVTPDSISLTTISGEDKQRIFSYTPVSTYSEFRYYTRPVWSPNSDVLGVVVPPPDPLAGVVFPPSGSSTRVVIPNLAYGIWRLPTDGTPARLAGTIEARGGLLVPVINPTLEIIAYLSSLGVYPERTDLFFVTWGDTIGEPAFYASRVGFFDAWSPGGGRFSFSRPPSEMGFVSSFIGQLDEEPRPLGNGESAASDVRWIDDVHYLYLQASDKDWDLLLADGSGTVTLIAVGIGQTGAFDAKK